MSALSEMKPAPPSLILKSIKASAPTTAKIAGAYERKVVLKLSSGVSINGLSFMASLMIYLFRITSDGARKLLEPVFKSKAVAVCASAKPHVD